MKRYIYIIGFLWFGMIGNSFAQSSGQNYIKTTTYLDAAGTKSMVNVQYFDGLGRPVQNVQKNFGSTASPNQDLISVQEYDACGHESKTWLPISKAGNNGNYYAGTILTDAKAAYNNDANPYSEPVYEASPLNRIVKEYGPGQAWRSSDHPVKTDYLANNSSYPCAYYYMSSDNLAKNGNYADGSLYVTQITDEDGKRAYEFKNKLGRVVLQRRMDGTTKHDTYYVYDDFGNLRFVLPPMAADSLTSNTTYAATTSVLQNYAYSYKYYGRNRRTETKLPGADPVYYVYDNADRLIFTQDGELRTKGQWYFTIPDVLGRTVLDGVCIAKTMTGTVKAEYVGNVSEQFSNTGYKLHNVTLSYLSLSGDLGTVGPYHIFYYDNYQFKTLPAFKDNDNYNYKTSTGFTDTRYGSDSDNIKTKGLLTGQSTVLLNSLKSLHSVFYYDFKGQMIQSVTSNHLNGYEKEYVNYSFSGQPTRKQTIHSASGKSDITETYTYAYDHADRPTTTKYKLNSDAEFTLSTRAYDDKGRLLTKTLSAGVIPVAYSYNIRSWLSGIKATCVQGPNPFEENLYYNESYAGNTPQYNGNISTVSWKLGINGTQQGYRYTYDGLNRLKQAQFLTGTTADNAFTEEVSEYDKHGNIKRLKRYARNTPTSAAGILADDLTLTYTGNHLKTIRDAVPASASTLGFVPSSSYPAGEYTYNKNGATTYDYNTGISNIQYNAFNLPDKITFTAKHYTQYIYDASGMKKRVIHATAETKLVVTVSGGIASKNFVTTLIKDSTDYCGNIIYENGTLKKILNPEGYVSKNASGGNDYNYYLKDHLGNNRSVIKASQTVYGGTLQEIDYYPFGMPHPVVSQPRDGISPERQPYKFGGKELDEMHGLNWYDQGARPFGAIIPITPTMDPLCEKYYSVSPYVQWGNNPVNVYDLHGDSIWYIKDDNVITMHVTGKVINQSSDNINVGRAAGDIASGINDAFSGEFEYGGQTYTLKTDVQLESVTTMDDVAASDHLFVLADADGKSARGTTNMDGGKVMTIYAGDYADDNWFSNNLSWNNTRNAVHEFGHAAGLTHPIRKSNIDKYWHNLMNSGGNGTRILPGQRAAMWKRQNSINKGLNSYYGQPYPYVSAYNIETGRQETTTAYRLMNSGKR